MKIKSHIAFILLSLFVTSTIGAMQVTDFKAPSQPVGRYLKFEFSFNLDTQFTNPFDPEEVDIQAVFSSPNGSIVKSFAFYNQDFRVKHTPVSITKQDGEKKIFDLREYIATSEPYWCVRFTPTEVGIYKYHLEIITPEGKYLYPQSGELQFECIPSQEHGFLRSDQRNPRYFRFDDGTSYFGVGINGVNTMGGCDQGQVRSFDVMLKEKKYNANLMQINLCMSNYLEWTKVEKRGFPFYSAYEGLGRYNLQVASQIDSAINLADSLDIYLRFTFYHATDFEPEFSFAENTPGFQENPYYIKNGGNCRTPMEFFTDEQSLEYQRKHFRYVIARWGYSPNILCWILWGEVDNIRDYAPKIVGKWLKDALDLLHTIDPNRHAVTSSFINPDNALAVYRQIKFDAFDFHSYIGFLDSHPFSIEKDMLEKVGEISQFNIPIIPGEYGYIKEDGFGPALNMKDDEKGLHLHDQLWASLMAGTSVTAMHWHWQKYIDFYNLYPCLLGIANFTKGEDFAQFRYFGGDKVSVDCATKKIKQVQIDIPTREAKQAGARIKPHYIEETVPEAFALGLVSSNRALVWVKDAGYDFVADNPSPYLDDVTLTVKGMADGAVNIEYWDNEKGIISSSAKEMVTGGKIELKLPRFTNDVGVKIYR